MGEAWRVALPRLPAVFGAGLLAGLLVVSPWVALALLVIVLVVANIPAAAIAVGIAGVFAAVAASVWLWTSVSLIVPAVVLENQGPVRALRRSRQLVSRSFWRILGIFLLSALIIYIAAAVLQIPFLIAEVAAGWAHPGRTPSRRPSSAPSAASSRLPSPARSWPGSPSCSIWTPACARRASTWPCARLPAAGSRAVKSSRRCGGRPRPARGKPPRRHGDR